MLLLLLLYSLSVSHALDKLIYEVRQLKLNLEIIKKSLTNWDSSITEE